MVREFERVAHRLPRTIACDNGPEFAFKATFFWACETGVKLHFIQPGKPTLNAFDESFNGKFPAYCPNLHSFISLKAPRSTIDEWRVYYNHVQPIGHWAGSHFPCSPKRWLDISHIPGGSN